MTPFIPASLDDAVKSWYAVIRSDHPLFELPVELAPQDRQGKQQLGQLKGTNLWMFATDTQKVMAHVYQPDGVEKILHKVVLEIYHQVYGEDKAPAGILSKLKGNAGSNSEEFLRLLSYHNFNSLLTHELFHNLYWPDSKEDEEKTDQAIARGIKDALPQTAPADLVAKTLNVRNLIWDFGIDTFQSYFIAQASGIMNSWTRELSRSHYTLQGQAIDHLPEGAVTIFDVVSCAEESKLPKGLYAANRYTYSLLFCNDLETRTNLLQFFEPRIKKGGIQNVGSLVVEALKGLVTRIPAQTLAEKAISAPVFKDSIDQLYASRESAQYENKPVLETMVSLLMDKRTRYDAVRGFIKPLAHLIEAQNFEPRCGKGCAQGAGGKPIPGPGALSNVLNAILGTIKDPKEQDQFLQQLAAGNASGGQGAHLGDPKNPYKQELAEMAADEYYKKHAPKIPIRSQDSEAHTIELGKIKSWTQTYSVRVPVTELHKHQRWIDFGLREKLPVLLELVPGQVYQVTYFRREEKTLESYQFEEKGIDLARNWVLIEDSSSSMDGGIPGCGTKWDALQHINYGVLKTLHEAAQKTGQEVDIWVVNFASYTQVAGPIPLVQFYEAQTSPEKRVMLDYTAGGTTLDTQKLNDIHARLQPGRTVWSYLTDGDILNAGSVEAQIKQFTTDKDMSVLFFELFCNSFLGRNLESLARQRKNVKYLSVTNMGQILQNTVNVLIQYEN